MCEIPGLTVYILVASGLVLLAALLAVALGGFHAIRNGSPSGAIALLLGLIVAATLIGAIVVGVSTLNAVNEARDSLGLPAVGVMDVCEA